MRYIAVNLVFISTFFSLAAGKSASSCAGYDVAVEKQVEYKKGSPPFKTMRDRTIYNSGDCNVNSKLSIESDGKEEGNMCSHRDVRCKSGDITDWLPEKKVVKKWDCHEEFKWGEGNFKVCKTLHETYVCDKNARYYDGPVHDADSEYKSKHQDTECNTNPIKNKPSIQYCCRKGAPVLGPDSWELLI